jgi:uncharacterized protein
VVVLVLAVPVGLLIGAIGVGGVLLPPALVLGTAPLTAIAASQVIQLPLVGFSVLGYAASGSVDYWLGSRLGVLAAVGVVVGAVVVGRLRPGALNRVAGVLLVAVGVFLLALPLVDGATQRQHHAQDVLDGASERGAA